MAYGKNTKINDGSAGVPGRDATENGSQIDEFIDRVAGDKAAPVSAKPAEERTQQTYSEISQSHDALLNELESSMDKSMQELDARYEKEFSRLDNTSEAEEKSEPDTGAQPADRMDARLLECGAKVEMLKARLEQSEEEVYKHCNSEIEKLEEQLAEARQKLAKMEGTDAEGWDRVKESLSSVMQELSKTVKTLAARLREAKAR
jgi:uncharacterized membrane-anchored protein YjiN (DUF445 family)